MSPFEEDDDDNPWPDEPGEFDPDSMGPNVDIPEAPSFDSDVDDDLFRTFWATVLLVNFGLFAVSLGAMFVVFQSRLELGGFVFLLGALALLFSYRRYRNYQREREAGDGDEDYDDGDGETRETKGADGPTGDGADDNV